MDPEPDLLPGAKPPETIHEYFVVRLRRLRAKHGLSQAQLAKRMNYATSLISMVETMQRPPTPDFAAACDTALDTDGALSDLLGLLAKNPHPTWFRAFVVLEAEAVAIEEFEVQVVPGLLQTEAYARAVFRADWPPRPAEELEQRLRARLERQAILTREQPPLLWFVLDESVLRRQVGSRADMDEQLERLVALATRPHMKVQILPLDRAGSAPLDGSFVILHLAGGERVAYLEGRGGAQILPDGEAVERCAGTIDVVRCEALSAAESIALMSRLKEELYDDR